MPRTQVRRMSNVFFPKTEQPVRVVIGYEPGLKATILNYTNVGPVGVIDLLYEAIRQVENSLRETPVFEDGGCDAELQG